VEETNPARPALRIRQKEEGAPPPKSKSKWRGFVIGLLAGQALIIGINFGLPRLLDHFKGQIAVQPGMPLGVLVFMGILGGLVITGLFIAFALVLSGFRGGSVWKGFVRLFKAGAVMGFTAAILGGTALVMIPTGQWRNIPKQMKEITVGVLDKLKETRER
jgi:hypothetical protein